MRVNQTVEDLQRQIEALQQDMGYLAQIEALPISGKFVFSPNHHRIVVTSLEELHQVRTELRSLFGWEDQLIHKFYSCGVVIITYQPSEQVAAKLPVPFELWIEMPPETMPASLLGDCKLVEEKTYQVICPIPEA